MYKLIALDMDGTLLNSEKKISNKNKLAITQAREQGVTVVLASGRPLEGIQDKLTELNINSDRDFVLFYNGSMVKNIATGEIIHQQIIDGLAAKKVARQAQKLGLFTHAFSQKLGLITPKNNPYTDIESEMNGLTATVIDFETLEDDHPIIKAMIVAEPKLLTQNLPQIDPSLHEQFTVVQSAPSFLEFLNPASNKGIGVNAIAKYLDIKPEEVICMGDAENDHHMLHYAGLSIAMDNAMPATKEIADFITKSNDEDGVAYAIQKFVLNENA